ncbi:MAG: redox-regulated ATPase YchF [Chloroflexi bacterium]|nr:redox-regulated ATPase YchF [Chloroflexota bacterium]
MGLEIGIVGLPNVGKSTLFNALTRAKALVADYPFTTIEPNVGVVAIPDTRLHDIAALVKPERVTPTTLRLVDIAGLVKGASQGEGLGNRFLGHIRNVDAVALVVRCFEDPKIPHISEHIDPIGDTEIVELELIMADLETITRRREKVRSQAKGKHGEFDAELAALDILEKRLGAGKGARGPDMPPDLVPWARSLNLLTAKPRLYVANVSESDLPDGGAAVKKLRSLAATEGAEVVVISARMECDLAEWDEEESKAYLQEIGLSESGLVRFIKAAYHLLNLITFFTATGTKEVRAWTLVRGTPAIEAAGMIHSDMERGFIRAEVVNYADFVSAGSLAAAREKGLVRLEGRDYVVQDGDVIHFRFSV